MPRVVKVMETVSGVVSAMAEEVRNKLLCSRYGVSVGKMEKF